MNRLPSLVLFACAAVSGFGANASNYDATVAASQAPYHDGGHLHALWLKDFAPGDNSNIDLSPLPLPAAFWLFASAIFALLGLRRQFRLS